jgi:hypothetical protein
LFSSLTLPRIDQDGNRDGSVTNCHLSQGTGSVTFQPLGLFSPYDIHQASRNYDIWDPLPLYIFKTSYLLRIVNLPHLCAQTSRVKVVSQACGLHCMCEAISSRVIIWIPFCMELVHQCLSSCTALIWSLAWIGAPIIKGLTIRLNSESSRAKG